jgi:hypothetical protein
MRRISGLAVVALWVVALTSASVSATGAAAKGPNPKTFPGAKVVTFKMVFEGSVRAVGTRTLTNALLGLCKVSGKDTIYENTDFARGKGVLMEFVRYKKHGQVHYAVQRVGRNGDASFAVVYKLKRKALGKTTVAPAFPPEPCLGIQAEDFSTNADCPKTISGSSNWGLRLKGDEFSLRPLKGSTAQLSNCGKSSDFGGFEKLDWQWPSPYPYDFEPLPLAKVFGRTSQFKVTLVQPDDFVRTTQGFAAYYDEHGPGSAVVRFIRVPNVP